MFGGGLFAIKQLSHRSSKQNDHLIDYRRSTQGNRFAADDGAASKETVGLINSPSDRAPPPAPEIDRCLGLLWSPRRARVGVSDRLTQEEGKATGWAAQFQGQATSPPRTSWLVETRKSVPKASRGGAAAEAQCQAGRTQRSAATQPRIVGWP